MLSGTLTWLFARYDGRVPFSDLVKQALAMGYTEPDPRDDLSGLDVARKLVILAREAGRDLSLDDVEVENLVPESLRGIDRELFITRLAELDAPMRAPGRRQRTEPGPSLSGAAGPRRQGPRRPGCAAGRRCLPAYAPDRQSGAVPQPPLCRQPAGRAGPGGRPGGDRCRRFRCRARDCKGAGRPGMSLRQQDRKGG